MEPNANARGVSWLQPSACFPPHRVTHPAKLLGLYRDFVDNGWDTSKPALVGYPWGEGIQLISGSHRHAAALEAGIRIPVEIVPYSQVWATWGHLERWAALLRTGGLDGTRGE